MKKIFLLFLVLYAELANTQINIDSLKLALQKTNTDTQTLNKYIHYIDTLSTENKEEIEIIGDWIILNSNTKERQELLAEAYYQKGKLYLKTVNIKNGTEYFNKAIVIAETNNYFKIQSKALEGLASIFQHTENKAKALETVKINLALSEKNNYKQGIGGSKYYLAQIITDYGYPKNKDTLYLRVKLFTEAINIFKELKDTARISAGYLGLAQKYAGYGLYDTSLDLLKKIEPFYLNELNRKYLPEYYFFVGKTYFQKANDKNETPETFLLTKETKKDLLSAVDYFQKCIPIATKYNDNISRMRCFDWLAYAYEELKEFKQAYNFRTLWSNINDSLGSDENFKNMADIQHKFEREKKDKEILKISTESKQKSTLNKIFIGSILGLFTISLLGYRNIKAKRKIEQQKITELEKEKQLLAVDAMLKGQEEERSRLAKDLHDGLGGMLSGVKLSFSNMKENLVMDNDNSIRFEKSISQLDGTIAELRKVAHNLMPEALVKFGLDAAIKDFCQSLTNPPQLNIIYQNPSPARVLDNTANVYVYRIVQELVNNAVKHSAANQILVQLSTNAEKAFITVEDNGKGMDKNTMQNSTGIGLSNIQKRVDYFKGSMEVDTNPGGGTSVNIELFV